MREHHIVVLGAGSLRCGPPVVATLAAWKPVRPVEVCLFEPCEERLDLMDRLLHRCLDYFDSPHRTMSTSQLPEACLGATAAVFALHEEAARRMVGGTTPSVARVGPSCDSEGAWHGDLNRPTPPDRLSASTREMLARPLPIAETRALVVQRSADLCLRTLPSRARIMSLMRGVLLPGTVPHVFATWPPHLSAQRKESVPHEVLRLIHGEDPVSEIAGLVEDSPLVDWLRGLE
jgi:hypothetical protein